MSVRLSLGANSAKKASYPLGWERPWLMASRQRWKLRAALLAVMLSPYGFYLAAHDWVLGGVAVQFGGIALAVALIRSVRCRHCDENVAWWALTSLPVSTWLHTLRRLSACPACGDRGDGSSPSG